MKVILLALKELATEWLEMRLPAQMTRSTIVQKVQVHWKKLTETTIEQMSQMRSKLAKQK